MFLAGLFDKYILLKIMAEREIEEKRESDELCIQIESLSDLKMEDAVRCELEASKDLNILIVGRFQVGKSTLINSLFFKKGERYIKRAEEGSGRACTKDVTPYTLKIGGVSFNIYDSPGLQDEKGDMKYLQLIAKECPSIHLIIYCKKMGEPMRPAEKAALKNLNLAFGSSIWNNAIIALTFANYYDPPDPDTNVIEFFEKQKETNVEEFKAAFEEFSIKKELFEDLKTRIYPVGSAKVLQLPGMGEDEDWRVGFWRRCLDACNQEARGAMLKLAWNDPHFLIRVVLAFCTAKGVGASILGGAAIKVTTTGIIIPIAVSSLLGVCIGTILGVKASTAPTAKEK